MVALAVSACVAQLAALQILGMAMRCASIQIKSPMNRSTCSCVQLHAVLPFSLALISNLTYKYIGYM